GIVPGALTDAAARIDGRLIAGLLLRQISVPGVVARAGGLRQVLANPVSAGQTAEIAAAFRGAGDKERHRLLGSCRLALRQNGCGPKQRDTDRRKNDFRLHIRASSLMSRLYRRPRTFSLAVPPSNTVIHA